MRTDGSKGACFLGYRGGAWHSDAVGCRSVHWGRGTPDYRRDYLGFRLAFSPEQ